MALMVLPLIAIALFGLLLTGIVRARRAAGIAATGDVSGIILSGLVGVNGAGIVAVMELVVSSVRYDRVTGDDLLLLLSPAIIVAGITAGSYLLRRNGRRKAAVWVCTIAAAPLVVAFVACVILSATPINMR